MDDNNKRDNTEEELDELLKAIEEIEEENKKQNGGKKRKRSLLSIEFGGVFHYNPFLNFLFILLMNFTLAYLLIELFNLAEYDNILYLVLFITVFTVAENIFKQYIMVKHFSLIFKSFGSIFYFGYIFMFYIIDYYVIGNEFNFREATYLIVFASFFTFIRYFASVYMKRKIRGQ